jgi:hypothetical protein
MISMSHDRFSSRAAFAVALLAWGGAALAEPVHIQHSGGEGSGYTFRRGNTCTVLTADHVVQHGGLPAADLAVLDRSGAKAGGQVSYSNPAYDVALIALPDDTEVACTSAWPGAGALANATLNGSTRFDVVRHYPDGREALILLAYAGGTPQELSLAPVDRTTIRESDSGSIVMLDNAPAAIVLRVRTADDRVDALRFDAIDTLVGDRFHAAAGARALSFAGVLTNGRENSTWSSYVRAWLTEQAGWGIVAAGDPGAFCALQVNVMSWARTNEANPDYTSARENATKICARNGFLAEQLCKVAEREVEDEPRTLTVHTIMLEASITPPSGTASSKLGTATYRHDASAGVRPEIELAALQSAFASVAAPLFESGACR